MNTLKKQPQRTCVGCNTKKDKRELVRIVRTTDGTIKLDRTGKLNGRGAYICDNIDCLNKAKKTKKLERAFEINISDEIYDELRGVIIDKSE